MKKQTKEIIKAVKGFNPDMTCTPIDGIKFQYEEGKAYKEEGDIEMCENGFHACKLPIDAFRYYPPTKSIYHEVEMFGEIDDSNIDKVCSSQIKIGAKINIAGIIESSIDIIREEAANSFSASRNYESVASYINYSNTASSGDYGNAVSSGDYSNAASSGDCGNAVSSGDYGNAVSSGHRGNAVSSGNCGNAVSSGCRGSAKVNHPNSCAIAWGPESKASGILGSHLVLAEWEPKGCRYWDEKNWIFKGATMVTVDGKNIKENTWYKLRNGKVVECDD